MKTPNIVFGETSGSDIPLEHGLQARKHFIKHNSEADHESLKNYTNEFIQHARNQAEARSPYNLLTFSLIMYKQKYKVPCPL